MDENAIKQLKVAELKSELTKLGLPTTGKKEELVLRLMEALANSAADSLVEGDGNSSAGASPVAASPVTTNAATNKAESKTMVTSPKSPTAVVSTTKTPVTVDDKLAERAARFNLPPSESERIAARSERFGITTTKSTIGLGVTGKKRSVGVLEDDFIDKEKLRQRQERFGVVTSSILTREEQEAQRLKRLERFGLPQ